MSQLSRDPVSIGLKPSNEFMQILLSPAKTLDFESPPPHGAASTPRLLHRTARLIEELKQLSPQRIGELMNVSAKLAQLNHGRFRDFEIPHPDNGVAPAVYAFRGDVYRGLQADDWTDRNVQYAQKHLRILSGLYGVLRPLDSILPYRLEMGTSLPIESFRQLYEFWGDDVGQVLERDRGEEGDRCVLNLASQEYYKSTRLTSSSVPVVAPAFKEIRDGKPKMITLFAKVARGRMASWVVRHRVRTVKRLLKFDEDGYAYEASLSSEAAPVFVRG